MAVTAFGLYGARHLGVAPDPNRFALAYVSWWTGPVAEVPVALCGHGSRAPHGHATTAIHNVYDASIVDDVNKISVDSNIDPVYGCPYDGHPRPAGRSAGHRI
ncbi:DUF2397 family protein [Streptomyces griseoluteus]|uniref:DUF2397 family protein n=1 Tax=Streptomyces griseoluteus TaxID=29306 RepID=A0A4Z1DER7_STRGP|nr:DUF2397 family protein [Streptomyces griseoluteus]TGN80345.1 DUF2397 family protein [Streptomyces griseoluteus]